MRQVKWQGDSLGQDLDPGKAVGGALPDTAPDRLPSAMVSEPMAHIGLQQAILSGKKPMPIPQMPRTDFFHAIIEKNASAE